MVFQYTGSNMFHSFPFDLLNHVISEEKNVVFLDTARPSPEQRYSLLFKNPLRIYRTRAGRHIGEILERISEESVNHWIAGYLSYEAAYWLEDKFRAPCPRKPSPDGDLLWFGVFDEPFIFDHAAGTWNRPLKTRRKHCAALSRPGKKPPPEISGVISRRGYFKTLRRIRKLIAAGDVYQVNFTYNLAVSSPLWPWEFYKELRMKQPVPFGAFIKTRGTTVASFSPELFFLRKKNLIRVKPMKGTAARGRFSEEDRAKASALAEDPKNRSENIMIVDLLRNDLGRICAPGSVAVRRLFEVERHPTVFQMTSTVEGRLRKRIRFADTIRALFPSGSVTGAPKIRAMEIISELERGARGVYCGAIGYSSPEGRAVFSVPIRTLQRNTGQKKWRFRVGSGVVWDSSAEQEWQECVDKYGFLTSLRPDFRLFETLLFSKGKFLYCKEHGKRLFDSACYFNFAVRKKAWGRTTQAIAEKLHQTGGRSFKVRIFFDRNGTFSWDLEPIGTLPESTVCVCGTAVDSDNLFLYHKTTFRKWYDKSMKDIRDKKYFDVLHLNRRGEVTEGARSNVFIVVNGLLYTPPVRCGLLPGVLRNRLLKAGKCKEKILFPEDLKKAEAVYCGNSVRGLVRVVVEGL
jgi:para-aminobenzoate synthetase / 4-amino-4-deoxychorismate lyase